MIKQRCVVTQIEDGKMHMTPRYSTHSEVINICPIALTERGWKVERKEGERWRWNQSLRERKKSSGIGLWRHHSYFPALLQTEPLNTLTEQQQRLFKTQWYLVLDLFLVFGPKVRLDRFFFLVSGK